MGDDPAIFGHDGDARSGLREPPTRCPRCAATAVAAVGAVQAARRPSRFRHRLAAGALAAVEDGILGARAAAVSPRARPRLSGPRVYVLP